MTASRVSLLAVLSVAGAPGCANDNAASAPTQRQVVLPVDGGTRSTPMCQPIQVGGIPGGCLGAWQCAEPEARQLACVATDGGLACACIQGDASVRTATAGSCATASDVTALARRLCSWEVL